VAASRHDQDGLATIPFVAAGDAQSGLKLDGGGGTIRSNWPAAPISSLLLTSTSKSCSLMATTPSAPAS